MSEFWKNQDLNGNGLQTINQQYSRLKRNNKTAYILAIFYPLGTHQFYLKAPKRGLVFLALSIAAGISYGLSPLISGLLLLAQLPLLVVDIITTDKQVIAFNKKLKINLSLQTNTAPPEGFRGRYHDDNPIDDYLSIKENEITAFETQKSATKKPRVFSFDEQEKRLKEMMTKNK